MDGFINSLRKEKGPASEERVLRLALLAGKLSAKFDEKDARAGAEKAQQFRTYLDMLTQVDSEGKVRFDPDKWPRPVTAEKLVFRGISDGQSTEFIIDTRSPESFLTSLEPLLRKDDTV